MVFVLNRKIGKLLVQKTRNQRLKKTFISKRKPGIATAPPGSEMETPIPLKSILISVSAEL
jgi:hypothetical protein